MSFSSEVKEELAAQMSPARHCRIAETASILSFCGKIQIDERDLFRVNMITENEAVARKYFTLLKKTFNIKADIVIRQNARPGRGRSCLVPVTDDREARRVLAAVRLADGAGRLREGDLSVTDDTVIRGGCCKRAFLRGAFLAAGSVSDPRRFYHFEIACLTEEKAEQVRGVIAAFGIDARIVARKKYHVVYIKEGDQISDLLGVMEAPRALMKFENIRILKEMRGSVNRQVNCETANIQKTVSAAVKQLEDIVYIRDTVGFGSLPDNLAEIAAARIARPEATLRELGESLDPPVGKSGVNHRLRKLSALAEELRGRSGPGADPAVPGNEEEKTC